MITERDINSKLLTKSMRREFALSIPDDDHISIVHIKSNLQMNLTFALPPVGGQTKGYLQSNAPIMRDEIRKLNRKAQLEKYNFRFGFFSNRLNKQEDKKRKHHVLVEIYKINKAPRFEDWTPEDKIMVAATICKIFAFPAWNLIRR